MGVGVLPHALGAEGRKVHKIVCRAALRQPEVGEVREVHEAQHEAAAPQILLMLVSSGG